MFDLSPYTTIVNHNAAHHARTDYARRWLELEQSTEPIPVDVPLSRKQMQSILFFAGSAETKECRHA